MTCVCVQGWRVLAASYDRSAQLWQRNESVPKVTRQLQERSQTCDDAPCRGASNRNTTSDLPVSPVSHLSQVTLTGHLRKVTAARFSSVPHQVVTGSTDKTIRQWDVHRAACQSSAPVVLTTPNPHLSSVTHLLTSQLSNQLLTLCTGVQVVGVASFCSDLVCCENCIISGHYDGAIRVWDSR